MGGKNFCPFSESDRQISFLQACQDVDKSSHTLGLQMIYDNAVQVTNDGMRLESLLASSVCVSSHINGLAGVPISDFLEDLVYQVTSAKVELKNVVEEKLKSEWKFLQDMVIPFLGPPNCEWPDWFAKNQLLNVENFGRTKNMDRIDFGTSDLKLCGETKDHKRAIGWELM